jgi:hypothetical protein
MDHMAVLVGLHVKSRDVLGRSLSSNTLHLLANKYEVDRHADADGGEEET